MADKWSQYEDKSTTDKWGQYEDPVATTAGRRVDNPLMTALRGIQSAATLGFDDEMLAGAKSLPGLFSGDFGKRYEENVARERAIKAAGAEANPWSSVGGQVVGGMIPGTTLLKGAQALPSLAKAAPIIAGSIQGGAQGAGDAPTMAEVPQAVNLGGTIGGVIGAVPGAANKIANTNLGQRFGKAYSDLAPQVTPKIGMGTGGFGTGAIYGNVNGDITPEDWSTDPYSAAANTIKYGVAGALAGKGLEKVARVAGAGQKMMRDGPPVPGPRLGEPTTFGGAGGSSTPPPDMPPQGGMPPLQPKGPTAPQGVAPEVARQEAMGKVSNSDTGEKAGQQVFGKIREQLDDWQNLGKTPPIPQRPPQAMGDLVRDIDGSMVPRGTERVMPVAPGALTDRSPAATFEAIKQMPPSTTNLPKPPQADMPDDNPMKPLLLRWKESQGQKNSNQPLGMVDDNATGSSAASMTDDELAAGDAFWSALRRDPYAASKEIEKYRQLAGTMDETDYLDGLTKLAKRHGFNNANDVGPEIKRMGGIQDWSGSISKEELDLLRSKAKNPAEFDIFVNKIRTKKDAGGLSVDQQKHAVSVLNDYLDMLK